MQELSPDRNLAHYRIIAKLGAGGMGEVYLAQDAKLDRKVALKILPTELASNRDRMDRFVREAKSAAALSHPNIAQIFEIGEDQGTHYIAMEFIDGQTLRDLIHVGRTELPKLLRYLQHAAEGLAKAHAAGIVHRDLKPDNIMVTRDRHTKILDFGLAKLIESQTGLGAVKEREVSSDVATAILPQQSAPGTVLGTVGYMSPEQAQGKTNEIDHRSDIFSFGCILYEAVTGRRAFAGKDAIDSLNKIIREPVAPIVDFNPTAPADLQRIVRRCLAKDADERYQTIKDVAIELREVRRSLSEVDTTATPASIETGSGADAQPTIVPGSDASSARSAGSLATHPSSAEYIVSRIQRHKIASVVVAVLALALVIGLAAYLRARNTDVAIDSIAVLPFANQNNDTNVDWVADGLTESIINSLTQLPALKVIPRSSSFRYKGKDADPIKAGTELGVRAVLMGRLQQRGDDLLVSAELVDIHNNKQLWGDHYQRKVSDLLAVENDIAREISARLRPTLSGTDASKVSKRYRTNSQAYELYLRGRYFWSKFTPEDLKRAADYFNQAIAVDPNFALAYAGLSDTYGASATLGWIPPRDGFAKAKVSATRALELDDSLAEAHATAGAINMFYDFDWNLAEREYQRALELNPNYELAYELYGYLLSAMGRLDEGVSMTQRGLAAAPLSAVLSDDLGLACYLARRYDAAIKQYQKTLELDPNDASAYLQLAQPLDIKGMPDEAVKNLQKHIAIVGRSSMALSWLGHAYAVAGKRAEAEKVLAEMNQMAGRSYVSPYDLAVLYVGLGDKDHALDQLNRAYDDRAGWLIYLNVEPVFDPIRNDPRFGELVRRMRFP